VPSMLICVLLVFAASCFCAPTAVTWNILSPDRPSGAPVRRYYHSASLATPQAAVIFGGVTFNGTSTYDVGDTWILNIPTWQWKEVVSTTRPVARGYHTTVSVPDGVLLFGGRTEQLQAFNDLWKFNPSTENWSYIAPNPTDYPPGGRFWHACAMEGGNMYMFGGFTWEHADVTNELWSYSVSDNRWTILVPNGDINSPRPRHGHTLVATSKNTLLLFGGRNNGRPELITFNDLWEYNITSARWVQLKVQGDPASPPARCAQTATAISTAATDEMVIFGGMALQAPSDAYYNDVWKYSRTTNSWQILQPDNSQYGPGRLAAHTEIYLPDSSIAIVGGYELFVGLHNYVWQMSGFE